MTLCQPLKGLQRIRDQQEDCIREITLRDALDHKTADSPLVKIQHETMSIAPLSTDGKEKGGLRKTKTAAVRQQPVNFLIMPPYLVSSCQSCYFRYLVHSITVS